MTDYTRTEKIGGDSILFCGHPSRAGNRYDSLATPLETLKSQTNILSYVVFVIFRMLSLSIVFICVVIMHICLCDLFTAFSYYVSIMWCLLWFGL